MTERLLTPAFVLVWIANLLQVMAFFLFVHLPGFLAGLGAGEAQIGVVIATAAVASILLRPAVGGAMDRRGRRPVILAGNIVNITAVSLYLAVGTLGPLLYLVRALHGIGEAALFTALSTYAADVIPATRRTQGLALFGISGLVPLALAGLIGDLLLSSAGYTLLFAVATGFAVAALAACLPLAEPPMPGGPRVSTPMRVTFARPELRPLWWVTFVFAAALAGYFTFIKTHVDQIGTGSVGAFFGAYATVAVAVRVLAGWAPDRLGPRRILYPALGTAAAGFVVLALFPTAAGVTAAGVFLGAGHAYVFPILYSMVVTRAAPRERGTAMAVFTGLFDAGTLVGSPALGMIIVTGGYATMFVVAALWLVVGTVSFARWDRANPA